MKISLLPHKIYRIFAVILFANLLFLAGTWLFHHHLYEVLGGNWAESSAQSLLLVEFSLANENVLATWYSSMLFLTVGLMSLLCFLVRKKTLRTGKEKYLNVAWLLFFFLFAGLSLDEMASLHERLGNIAAFNPLGDYPLGWIFLLGIPIAFICCLMSWFFLIQIKRTPVAVVFAVFGILLFASVPLQEYVEVEAWNAASNMATWQRPVHFLLIEEGSELFAATFMLIASFIFLLYSLRNNFSLNTSPGLELRLHRGESVFLTGLICGFLLFLLLLLINSPSLALEGDPGVMHNWFPSAIAFLTFLSALSLFYADRRQRKGLVHPYLLASYFSLFLSLYYGANIYGYFKNPTGTLWKIAVVSILCISMLSIGFVLFRKSERFFARFGIALWTLLMLAALPMSNRPAAILSFLAFSALLLVLVDEHFQRLAISRSPVVKGSTEQKLSITLIPPYSNRSDRETTAKTGRSRFTTRRTTEKNS